MELVSQKFREPLVVEDADHSQISPLGGGSRADSSRRSVWRRDFCSRAATAFCHGAQRGPLHRRGRYGASCTALDSPIPIVSGEQFVAAVPRQGHRHVLAGHFREIHRGNRRAVGERLVILPDQLAAESAGPRARRPVRDVRSADAAAASRAYERSSNSLTGKPIENVLTGRSESCCINPAMIVESIPPDRNAPSGTSLRIRRRTASVNVSRSF